MKKIFVMLMLIGHCVFAQNGNDLGSTLSELSNMQVFKDCQVFKTQIETQVKEAGRRVSSAQQMKALETSYTQTWQKYDFFLKTVKQDLVIKQKTQNLSLNPDASANLYLTLLEDTKREYNSNFLPVYQSITGGKDVVDEVLKIGIDLVKKIILKIKARKIEKNEALNSLLPQVNQYFYDNIRLKTFSELDVSTSFSNKVSVNVPVSTLNSMEGNIEFIQVKKGEELSMDFEQNEGKNIVVDTESDATYKTSYFTSVDNYSVGTKFRIRANADAFIYVLVLNTDGVKLLHPSVEYVQTGKNIDVTLESSPTNGVFSLPREGLFTIVASTDGNDSDSEDFALLISKSELIMEDTIEKINGVSGQLDERFSQVFSTQQITLDEAQVQVSGSQFSFSYQKTDKNILPLVFKIRK